MKLFITFETERNGVRVETEQMPMPEIEVIVTTPEGQVVLPLKDGESLHLTSKRRKKKQ